MSHLAWDRGAIADAMKQVIGCAPAQKTTKTYCGLRVPTAQIDEQHPTCDRCIARWAEDEQAAENLLREHPELKPSANDHPAVQTAWRNQQ